MRILGIDYGDRNIGLALSDALGITAQPLEDVPADRSRRADRRRSSGSRPQAGDRRDRRRLSPAHGRHAGDAGGKDPGIRRLAGKSVGRPGRVLGRAPDDPSGPPGHPGAKGRMKAKRSVVNQISAAIILQGYLDSRRSRCGRSQDRVKARPRLAQVVMLAGWVWLALESRPARLLEPAGPSCSRSERQGRRAIASDLKAKASSARGRRSSWLRAVLRAPEPQGRRISSCPRRTAVDVLGRL